MKIKELANMVRSGVKPTISFREGIAELDGYAEPNMRATVASAHYGNDDPDVVKITFDYGAFDSFNELLETPNYFGKGRDPVLTARQAGAYKQVEDYYFDANDDCETFFSVMSERSMRLYNMHLVSDSTESYIEWLENNSTLLD